MFHSKAHVPAQSAILSDASLDFMHSTVSDPADSPGRHYGIGWWSDDDFFGYRSIFAAGGTNDSAATLQIIPSEGIVIAVVSNTGTSAASQIVEQILSDMHKRTHPDSHC
jgi:CubicO group peptidase (beta-lactamase class C family)